MKTSGAKIEATRHLEQNIIERLGKTHNRLTEIACFPEMTGHEGVAAQINGDLPQSPAIIERLGEAGSCTEKTELECSKCEQGVAEIAPQIDGLLLPLAGLGQRLTELERPFKRADGLGHG